ncbi:MAG: clostripain-related cysteine peptidase, partial [Clostridia bacterium]|nr:clostripain-related cysteine peptidase [Clostridia bacterium]
MIKKGFRFLFVLWITAMLLSSGPAAIATGGDSWAVYIYLCGTDLETEAGMATDNMVELLSVGAYNPEVNVYFQTGGTRQWQNDNIDASVMQRYHVDSRQGDIVLLEEGELTSMGDEATLLDFLQWAVRHNTAEKMGIIFWNHGGGAMDGVEFDELYDSDSLSLAELKNAFCAINPASEPFLEFVGFDCCLMANIEIATILGDHARYLIASEEVEPGGGWDYYSWYTYLCENPGATGAELGVTVCDTYYRKCEQSGDADMATLSVIDLSMANELYAGFTAMAISMRTGSFSDQATNAAIMRGVRSTERYGGQTEGEGYTNLVDVGHMAYNIADVLIDGGAALLEALDSAVVYNVCGPYRSNSTGLSVFYPMMMNTSDRQSAQNLYDYIEAFDVDEYGVYITGLWGIPYDSSGLALAGQPSPDGGTYDGYDDGEYDEGDDYEDAYDEDTYDEYEYDEYEYDEDIYDEDAYGEYDGEERLITEAGASSAGVPAGQGALEVSISGEPSVNDDGYYTMTIDPATLDHVREVFFSLYVDLEDNVFCYLGSDNDLDVNWETGDVADNFRGVWPSVDGQYVTFEIAQSTDQYIIYSIPIKLNGERTNLRVVWEWDDPEDEGNHDGKFTVWGAWDGVGSTGMSSRVIQKIQDGDVIVPLMYAFRGDDPDNGVQVEGDPITVSG